KARDGQSATGTFTGSSIAPAAAPVNPPASPPVATAPAPPVVAPEPEPVKEPVIEKPVVTPAQPKARVLALKGFKPGSSVVSASMKKSLINFAKSAPSGAAVTCIGYTMGPTILKADDALAKKRADNVCKVLATAKTSLGAQKTKSITTRMNSSQYRRAIVTVTF
ncbi:MAG: hypothetical protein ACKOUD_01895, partial [Rhodoluna sp.]